ncbi:MAG: hypothetical protein A3E87_07845 [Gammaproteobacteria bacterium RIFCSPHIGHO2_12_FULL_35_23]|nr:MAG: hypothetical protein A3E87_07845 [Gammaproteobacteria bacterium RIFCSPHIGHO2_12_FULL_35_23]
MPYQIPEGAVAQLHARYRAFQQAKETFAARYPAYQETITVITQTCDLFLSPQGIQAFATWEGGDVRRTIETYINQLGDSITRLFTQLRAQRVPERELELFQTAAENLFNVQSIFCNTGTQQEIVNAVFSVDSEIRRNILRELAPATYLNTPGFYRLANTVGLEAIPIPPFMVAATAEHPGGIRRFRELMPSPQLTLATLLQPQAYVAAADGLPAIQAVAEELVELRDDPIAADFTERLNGLYRRIQHYKQKVERFLMAMGITESHRRRFTETFDRIVGKLDVILTAAARNRAGLSIQQIGGERLYSTIENLLQHELGSTFQLLKVEQFRVVRDNHADIRTKMRALGQDEAAIEARIADCEAVMWDYLNEQEALLRIAHGQQREFLGIDPDPLIAVPRQKLVQRYLLSQDQQFVNLIGLLDGPAWPDSYRFGSVVLNQTEPLAGIQQLLGYEPFSRSLPETGYNPENISLANIEAVFHEYEQAAALLGKLFYLAVLQPAWPFFQQQLATLTEKLNSLATARERARRILQGPPPVDLTDVSAVNAAIARELQVIHEADLTGSVGDFIAALQGLRDANEENNPIKKAIMQQLRAAYPHDAQVRFNFLLGSPEVDARVITEDSKGVLPTLLRELTTRTTRVIDIQKSFANPDPGIRQRNALHLRSVLYLEQPGFVRLVEQTAQTDPAGGPSPRHPLLALRESPQATPPRGTAEDGEFTTQAGGINWTEPALGIVQDPYFMRHLGAEGIAAASPAPAGTAPAASAARTLYQDMQVAGGVRLGRGFFDLQPALAERRANLIDNLRRYVIAPGALAADDANSLTQDPFAYINAFRRELGAVLTKQRGFFSALGLVDKEIEALLQPQLELVGKINLLLSPEARKACSQHPPAKLIAWFNNIAKEADANWSACQARQVELFESKEKLILSQFKTKFPIAAVTAQQEEERFADFKAIVVGLQSELKLVVFGDATRQLPIPAPGGAVAPAVVRKIPGLLDAQRWFVTGERPVEIITEAGAAAGTWRLQGGVVGTTSGLPPSVVEANQNRRALMLLYNPVVAQVYNAVGKSPSIQEDLSLQDTTRDLLALTDLAAEPSVCALKEVRAVQQALQKTFAIFSNIVHEYCKSAAGTDKHSQHAYAVMQLLKVMNAEQKWSYLGANGQFEIPKFKKAIRDFYQHFKDFIREANHYLDDSDTVIDSSKTMVDKDTFLPILKTLLKDLADQGKNLSEAYLGFTKSPNFVTHITNTGEVAAAKTLVRSTTASKRAVVYGEAILAAETVAAKLAAATRLREALDWQLIRNMRSSGASPVSRPRPAVSP